MKKREIFGLWSDRGIYGPVVVDDFRHELPVPPRPWHNVHTNTAAAELIFQNDTLQCADWTLHTADWTLRTEDCSMDSFALAYLPPQCKIAKTHCAHWKFHTNVSINKNAPGCFFLLVPPQKVLSMELVPPNRKKMTKYTGPTQNRFFNSQHAEDVVDDLNNNKQAMVVRWRQRLRLALLLVVECLREEKCEMSTHHDW